MSTRAWMIWTALLLPLAGCGGSPKETGHAEEAGHEATEAGEHADHDEAMKQEEAMLAVDAEVLRDLKLTTFPAELRPGGPHPGIDMAALPDTPVVAVADGIWRHDVGGAGGNGAWLTGLDNVSYYYAHFSKYSDAPEGLIKAGEVIGYVGMTGNATGPHLHFEIHPGKPGEKPPVDPFVAHGAVVDRERRPDGTVERALTLFLAGAECPFTCSFCDLWRYTIDGPTPPGALPRQVAAALDALDAREPRPDRIKLYNASNFFDRRAVPLKTQLQNGETVEIITQRGAHPNPSWVNFVTTAKARNAIRGYLKNLKRDEAQELGRRLINQELLSYSLSLKKTPKARLQQLLKELGLADEFIDHASRDEILEDAGLTDQRIARDIVAQVLGTRIPVARPLPEDAREYDIERGR